MEQLPERFPAKKVPAETLHEIAGRARKQFAGGDVGAPEPPLARSPVVAAVKKWMASVNIGVLDLAALAALVFLSISLLGMYLNSHAKALREAQRTAEAKLRTASPAGDGKEEPKPDVTPEPPPAPKPIRNQDSVDSMLAGIKDAYDRGDFKAAKYAASELLKLNPTIADAKIWESKAQTAIELAKLREIANRPRDAVSMEEIVGANPGNNGARPFATDANRGGLAFGDPAKNPLALDTPGGRTLLAKRNGGSKATVSSTDLAAQWLAYHQEADGHWDATKYGAGNKVDTAVTAMGLLALLRSGSSPKSGIYKDNVQRAVDWLMAKQQASGLIFEQTDAGAHRGIGYPGGIAALALCEAAQRGRSRQIVEAATAAMKYASDHQQGEGADKLGWRYTVKTSGDISVSGWWIQAIVAGKRAGLPVDHDAFDGAVRFLDSVEIKGDGGSHYAYQPGKEPNKRRGAIGNLSRQLLGWKPADLQKSVETFVNDGGVPSWGANGESTDLYYWYYGTLCTFQQSGAVWDRWNTGLKKALTENQCRAGDDAGSWPVVGDFAGEWGRVGQTALGCLCLDVYYQYRATPDEDPVALHAAAPAAPAAQNAQANARVLENLKIKVTFNFVDKQLPEVIKFLNDLTDTKVELSPEAAKLDANLNLHVTEMSLDLAIDWIAKLYNCEKRIENGKVIIDVPHALPQQNPPGVKSQSLPAPKDEF